MVTHTLSGSSALETAASRLAREAVGSKDVPVELAEEAHRAVLRRFADVGPSLSRSERGRMRAYFWGVVRRRSIRSRDALCQRVRSRYLVMSIAEDLRAAGRTPEQVLSELRTDFARELKASGLEASLATPE